MSQRSGRLNTKENMRSKERMTSLENSTSTAHSKAKLSNRSNFLPIKNMKNGPKSKSKISSEDFEKMRRKCEKQKGYIANQKINEK